MLRHPTCKISGVGMIPPVLRAFLCKTQAGLAHHHYDQAQRILAAKPRGRIKTPRLMGAVYSEILRASEAQGFAPPRRRVSLPKSRLVSLVLRQGLFS